MTLTQVATLTRRGILIFITLTILGIIGMIGLNFYRQYELAHRPKVEEKPELRFGPLPTLTFPPSVVSSSNFSYTLNTTTGELPETPKLGKVYFIPPAATSLLSPEKGQRLAESLGFPLGPKIISPTQYQFTNQQDGQLTIDITTSNFHAETNASPSAQVNPLMDQSQIVQIFKNYLQSKNLLTKELSGGRSFIDSSSKEISLWPADFDNLPIVTAYPNRGLIRATFIQTTEGTDHFKSLDYTFWPIDETTSSTYPLKTAEQAFTDLRSGLGFISIEPNSPQVSLSLIYLAYFQTEEYVPYLQPVFVFEGPFFTALVPAIAR